MPKQIYRDEDGDFVTREQDVYVTKESMIEYLGSYYYEVKRWYTKNPAFDKNDWVSRSAHIANISWKFKCRNLLCNLTKREMEVFKEVINDLYDELPDMPEEKKNPKTKEKYYPKRLTAPTLTTGAFVAIFLMALTCCCADRYLFWIIIIIGYCIWAYLEIWNYNSIHFINSDKKKKQKGDKQHGSNNQPGK